MRKDSETIQNVIVDLVIYSNGAISWSEAWMISPAERDKLIKALNKYLQQKSGKSPDEYL